MSSGGGKSQTITQNSAPWAPQQSYLETGFQRALDNLNSDQGAVPMSPQTTSALQQMEQRARAGSPIQGASSRYVGDVLSGEYLKRGNPYLREMTAQLGEAIRPSIDATFASTGRLGSGAHMNAYSSALANAAGNLAYQQYGAERGMQQQALGMAPAVMAGDYADADRLAGVGAAYEGQTRAQNLAAEEALMRYMQMVGGQYGGTSTSQVPGSGSGLMQGLGTAASGIGALGQLASGAAALFSDARVKENVRRVGMLDNGLPVYSYNYKWDDPARQQIGVMAQDVEQVKPGAVTEIGGIKAVDYGAAVT